MLIFGIFRNTKYIEIINYIITTLKTDIISVLILDCRLLQYNTLLEDTVPVRYIKQIIEKTAIFNFFQFKASLYVCEIFWDRYLLWSNVSTGPKVYW